MLEKLQMYINGEWVDSHSTETIEVMNPSDDSVLGVITAGNSDDVDKAVAAAKAAFVDFSFSTKEERVQILENIITEYEKRSEELAETISKKWELQYGYPKLLRLLLALLILRIL